MRWFFFLIVFWPAAALAQGLPDYVSTTVNDFADLLTAEQEDRVKAALAGVRQARGVEMTVVTIERRSDYGDWPGIEPFATALFNKWGIGDRDRNDGIMVLVARSDREMRIELGAGYPPSFDHRMKTVIDTVFIPWFRDGNYGEGIAAGVTEVIRRSVLEPDDIVAFDPETPQPEPRLSDLELRERAEAQRIAYETMRAQERRNAILIWTLVGGSVGGAGFGGWWLLHWRRYRPRHCPACSREMELLDEAADDRYLEHGQTVEERVKSKDYDVWLCPQDDTVVIEGYKKWFSGHSACSRCGYKTSQSHRTVLIAATTSSTGSARVRHECKNCGHTYTEMVTLPRKSKSSSSSSSGSSFSGGSSSGGGASGSW